MKKDLEQHLLEIQLEAKRRRRFALKFVIGDLVVIFVVSLAYFFVSLAENIKSTMPLIVAILIYSLVFYFARWLIRPLAPQERAFVEIFEAIKLLKKSSEKIFLEETLSHLKKAHKLLERVSLEYLNFYMEVNNEVRRLREITKGVIPALKNGELELAELEEIGSTLAEPTLENLKRTNDQLWEKYHGKELQEFGLRYHASRFFAATPGRAVMSLALGYGLIILISFVYCLFVDIDFVLFCKQNPSTIIMGGAILSGISFFGKKPP
jgi:hypothetical protein